MYTINHNLEINEGSYSNEFIRANNATKYIHSTRTLEVRCQYCRNFIHIEDKLSFSHMEKEDREIVCEDCFRFSKLWRSILESFFRLKLMYLNDE